MIYTAITGGRDQPRNDIKVFGDYAQFVLPVMNAKIYKVLAHLFVPGDSIWVDGNIKVSVPEKKIFSSMPYDCELGLFRHPERSTAMEEARCLRESKFGISEVLEEFIEQHTEGFGRGLFEGNVIIRRDCEKVRRFNEIWWSLICRWPYRDQITMPQAVRESGCRVHCFEWGDIFNRKHEFFEYHKHKKEDNA